MSISRHSFYLFIYWYAMLMCRHSCTNNYTTTYKHLHTLTKQGGRAVCVPPHLFFISFSNNTLPTFDVSFGLISGVFLETQIRKQYDAYPMIRSVSYDSICLKITQITISKCILSSVKCILISRSKMLMSLFLFFFFFNQKYFFLSTKNNYSRTSYLVEY